MNAKLPAGVSSYLRGLRHIGIVTEDADALIARFQGLFGLDDEDILRIPEKGQSADTRFAFFDIGGVPYEVIEPVSEHFRALLLNGPAGINHICYNVENLPAAVAAMREAGVRLGHVTPDGIVELPRFRMAYFHPADTAGLLLEFVEEHQ